jgi:hypothetical protein
MMEIRIDQKNRLVSPIRKSSRQVQGNRGLALGGQRTGHQKGLQLGFARELAEAHAQEPVPVGRRIPRIRMIDKPQLRLDLDMFHGSVVEIKNGFDLLRVDLTQGCTIRLSFSVLEEPQDMTHWRLSREAANLIRNRMLLKARQFDCHMGVLVNSIVIRYLTSRQHRGLEENYSDLVSIYETSQIEQPL